MQWRDRPADERHSCMPAGSRRGRYCGDPTTWAYYPREIGESVIFVLERRDDETGYSTEIASFASPNEAKEEMQRLANTST